MLLRPFLLCYLQNSYKEFGYLTNWTLAASNDGIQWNTLRRHENDNSLKDVGMYESAQWNVECDDFYSYFKVQMDASNDHSGYLQFGCCGFEINGQTTNEFDYFYHDQICLMSHYP